MAEDIIIRYQAEIDGYKAELKQLEKADATTREAVEKPINITANTKDLKDALKAIAVSSGEIDLKSIDKEIDAMVKDSKKLKQLFDELASSASKMDKGSAEYKGLLSVMNAIDAEIKSLTADTETFEETSVQATKSLKAQLREAQADVARLSEEFGVTSKEAVNAAKRAAELKDQIGDAKALTDAFNPDAKFQALSSSISGVVGGFQAYEGALALVGSESEDLQKTLVKLQGIMALSQGLQQLGEAKDSFTQLGAVIKDKVMTAFTTLRGAMAALGIGAIAIAIGLIVANWEELVGWIEKTFPGLKKVTDFFKNFQQVSSGVINATISAFKSLGSIIGNFFAGDWSAAYNDAKNLGKNMANAYNQGYAEKDAELKRKQAMKDRKFAIDLLEAQGKEVKGSRLKYAQEELKDLKKGSDDYNAKLIEIEEIRTDIRNDGIKKREEAQKKADENRKKKNQDALEAEKENINKLIAERDRLINEIDRNPIEDQKKVVARLQTTGQDPKEIEAAQQKLLQLETDYNNQKYAITLDYIKKENEAKNKAIADATKNNLSKKTIEDISKNWTDAIDKTKEEAKNLNTEINNQLNEYENKDIKLKIQTILDSKPANDYYDDLNKREEELKKKKFNSKLEELQGQKELINIQNERYARELELLKLKKQALDEELKKAGVNISTNIDSQKLQKEIDELNAKIKKNTTIDIDAKISDQSKAQLKAQLDSLFEFASNGLLLQIGIDPQALAKLKSDVENAYKVLNDPNATDQQKLLAGAQAAQSAVVMGIDAIRNAERQAAEEKLAEIAVQEEAELKSAEGNEQKQAIIRQKYEAKRKEVKRKEFEADKRANITKAIINTAVEIAKVAATPFLIPIVAAIGAAQVALIASQPVPKFEKGGLVGKPISDGLLSGKPHSAGGVLLEAEGGEFIINRKATKNHLPLLEAINDGSISDILNKHYILPSIQDKEAEVMQKSEKRITDIQNTIINKTISKTLEMIRKDNNVNADKIVTAIKKDTYKL